MCGASSSRTTSPSIGELAHVGHFVISVKSHWKSWLGPAMMGLFFLASPSTGLVWSSASNSGVIVPAAIFTG